MTDKKHHKVPDVAKLCVDGENWRAVIQQTRRCSLRTCSDRLHMPGNLEFISPPFLISASVIQINSNEISRGKAPFGWGVLLLPTQPSPIQRSSPWATAEQPPSTHPRPKHVEE